MQKVIVIVVWRRGSFRAAAGRTHRIHAVLSVNTLVWIPVWSPAVAPTLVIVECVLVACRVAAGEVGFPALDSWISQALRELIQ